MTPETLTALKGSIAKWEAIAANEGDDGGADNCPLCDLFNNEGSCCRGCPVLEATGKTLCDATPFAEWHAAGGYAQGEPPFTPNQLACAQREVEFLQSLLPEEIRP